MVPHPPSIIILRHLFRIRVGVTEGSRPQAGAGRPVGWRAFFSLGYPVPKCMIRRVSFLSLDHGEAQGHRGGITPSRRREGSRSVVLQGGRGAVHSSWKTRFSYTVHG